MPFDPSAARSGTTFSSNPTYQGAWLVYVNGIEVPTLGFEVRAGVWQIPEFTIHMVPDILIQRLGNEDRVPVQIFYLDSWLDPDKPEFRLLVDGEIIGWRFSSAGRNRSIAFTCLAHIHVFQQLYFYYMTTVDDVVMAQAPEVSSSGFTQAGLLYPYSLFHQGLLVTRAQVVDASPTPRRPGAEGQAEPPLSPADGDGNEDSTDDAVTAPIKAPFELVYNVIKGVIGTMVPPERRSVPMMNFFAQHIRKTRFHNRWVRLPILEDPDQLVAEKGVFPIFNACRADAALGAMQRQVTSQVGNSGPVWNMLQQILSTVYMEIGMIPNPAVVLTQLIPATGERTSSAGDVPVPFTEPQDGKILGPLTGTTSVQEQVSPQLIQRSYEMANEAEAIATRLRAVSRGENEPNADDLALAGLTSRPASDAIIDPVVILRNLQRRAGIIQDGTFTGPPPPPGPETVEPTTPVRLAQYFVKPQFLFGIPPHCNVFFPSMITAWTYDENYINQPTRVYVNDSVMTRLMRAQGPNREFMIHALTVAFPEEADAVLHHKLGSSEFGGAAPGATESGKNLLIWPEENFKGVVTDKVDLPAWFQQLQQYMNATPSTDPDGAPTTRPTLNNPNADVTAVAPVVIPGAGTPRTAQTATGLVGTAGPEMSTPSRPGEGSQYGEPVASRVLVGRQTAIVLNGAALITRYGAQALREGARFKVEFNSGLDPDYYRPLVRTALWPLPPPSSAPRRQRSTPPSGFRDRTPQQKLAQLMRLMMPSVRAVVSGLTAEQEWAVTFGFLYIAFCEGATNITFNWGFGNQKQYSTYERDTWTIQPDSQAYLAAESPQDGANKFVRECARVHASSVRVLLSGRSSNAALQAIINTLPAANAAKFARLGNVRPDAFYVALGFNGYYSQESDVRGAPPGFNQQRRAQEGVRRIGNFIMWYDRTKQVWDSGQVPEDVRTEVPYPHRPLISQDDLNFLRTQNAVSAAGGRANIRTVSRPLPRIAIDGRIAQPGTGASPGPVGSHTTNTTPVPTSDSADGTPQQQSFAALFRLYAQYEYLRKRYMQRQAGLQLCFNPYVVPGFPSMVFDSMRTRMHVVGYVQTFAHSAYASEGGASMTTTVQLTCCRTLPEFINDVRTDAERFASRVVAAPAEIIRPLRVVIQDEQNAETFYRRLLYGNAASPNNTPAAFRWDAAMGYANGADVEDIEIVGERVADSEARQQRAEDAVRAATTDDPQANEVSQPNPTSADGSVAVGGVASEGQQTVRTNLDPNLELSPKANEYGEAFDSFAKAMQLCARPACTLTNYIRFWYAGMTPADLLARGEISGPREDFAYAATYEQDVQAQERGPDGHARNIRGTVSRSSAVYYDRIFKLRPGPGIDDPNFPPGNRLAPPTGPQRGYTDPPAVHPTPTTEGLPVGYPQTRADWDSVLIAYRDKIRTILRPT